MSQSTETATDRTANAPLSAADRFGVIERPALEWTPEVADETAHLYEKVKDHIPKIEWPVYAPYVAAINRLKKERNAVILAHNYQTPEIFHCVADIRRLAAARQGSDQGRRRDHRPGGVHFMAETSKLLNPEKTVLIPDMEGRLQPWPNRSPAADVKRLRERYPGVPIVTYVNTSAEVKAETDICCTSSNAVQVVESFGVDRVLASPTNTWQSTSPPRPR
jgi:quinolinate synthase